MTQVPSPATASDQHPLDVDRSVVAVGVALLAAAVALSTLYSRFDGELDWSNYVVGLLATAGLLGVAAVGLLGVVVPRAVDATTDLVAWPGAFGALGVGLMIGVALDDSSATAYVAGLAVLLLSAAGYAATRRAPFVVTAILGFAVLYAQLFEDVVGLDDGDDVGGIGIAASLALFAVLVTAAGWLLPTRALGGVVAGALTVAGFASLTGTLAVASAIQAAFAPMVADGPVVGVSPADYDDDAWVILVLALLLMLGWAACAALTRHVGFRILVVAMAVSVLPLATLVLRAEHPTWWGVVVAAVGGALLVAVGARASGRGGSPRTHAPTPMPSGPPPSEPPAYTAPHTPPPAGPPPSGPPAP